MGAADLFSKRLVVVAGKGGAGRTSVAAALAVAAARHGRRVLLAQAHARDRLGVLLGGPRVGEEIVRVRERLDAVNMTPAGALREYGLMVLRYAAVYRAVFENRVSRAFLRAIPGLEDYSMLGKAWYHTTEEADGRPRWDLVILDGPATGHIVTMLRIPQVILAAVPEGPLTRDARAARALMTDPARTAVVVVALAEEMAANEAVELSRAVAGDLGMPLGPHVVNAIYPPRFVGESAEARVLAGLAPGGGAALAPDLAADPVLGPPAQRAVAMRARRLMQEEHLARLAHELPRQPQLRLPAIFTPRFGVEAIERLARELEAQLLAPV